MIVWLLLEFFLSKIKRLVKLKQENEIEKNIDNVITRHKPPIFWKEKDFCKTLR